MTCGACCPYGYICSCLGCWDPSAILPSCPAVRPDVVYSCCNDVDSPCNLCNYQCCRDDDVCTCKGTCVKPGDPMPVCTPDEYNPDLFPDGPCCDPPRAWERCAAVSANANANV